jgi:hypothetical protein
MESMELRPVKGESRVLLFTLVFSVGVFATGLKASCNALSLDCTPSGQVHSQTVAESKSRGILVAELQAVPGSLNFECGVIRFGEAWLEERSLPTHWLVWLPFEKRTGGATLCFTLAQGDEVMRQCGLFFVADDRGAGVGCRYWGDGATLYSHRLEDTDLDELRFSLVSSWHEARPKNIRFVRKSSQ